MRYNEKLHEAFIVIAENDINLLSYEGQTLWNKFAKMVENKEIKEK